MSETSRQFIERHAERLGLEYTESPFGGVGYVHFPTRPKQTLIIYFTPNIEQVQKAWIYWPDSTDEDIKGGKPALLRLMEAWTPKR